MSMTKVNCYAGSKWNCLIGAIVGTVCILQTAHSQQFTDNFARVNDPGPTEPWVVQSGNWTVTSGVMQGGTNALQSYATAFITNNWTNYAVEARIQLPVGAFGGGLGGRVNPDTGA